MSDPSNFPNADPDRQGGADALKTISGGAAAQGADVGGIAQRMDAGLEDSAASAGETPAVGPTSTGGLSSAGGTTPDAKPGASPSGKRQPERSKAEAKDESALESLGKAIGAPLSGEASKDEPRR